MTEKTKKPITAETWVCAGIFIGFLSMQEELWNWESIQYFDEYST